MRIGIYLSSGDVNREIPLQIAKLKECKATRANLWIQSPDGRRASLLKLSRWSRVLSSEGIEPWLWTFPNAAHARDAGEHLLDAIEATDAVGAWLDIERPPPSSPAREWTIDSAEALSEAVSAATVPIGITSYPVRSNFSKHIPFGAFSDLKLGAPQLYHSASNRVQRERAIREWAEAHKEIVPIVGSFIGGVDRLDSDIRAVTADRFESFDVWVLAAMSKGERYQLGKWADK